MPLFSICAAICWIPPRCPARYRWTFRFVTSSMSRPVVSVAYRVFLLRIPLYAMQKFCIKIFFASCATNPMFMICYPLLIFSYLKPYIQNQTDSDTEADKRCQPVAYKGKCKAGVWHQASRNTDVDKALKKDQSSHPHPTRVPGRSLACLPMLIHSKAIRSSRIIMIQHPRKPSSSPATAKIKSVWDSEMKFPFFTDETTLLSRPFP